MNDMHGRAVYGKNFSHTFYFLNMKTVSSATNGGETKRFTNGSSCFVPIFKIKMSTY